LPICRLEANKYGQATANQTVSKLDIWWSWPNQTLPRHIDLRYQPTNFLQTEFSIANTGADEAPLKAQNLAIDDVTAGKLKFTLANQQILTLPS